MENSCVLSFLPCFRTFSGLSLTKREVLQKVSSLVLVLFKCFLNHLQKEDKGIYSAETNTFGAGDKCVCASEERFSAGDEYFENLCSNLSHTNS